MGGSEKDSFESLRGMEPEMVSGSGRVEGTQPERVAFKSAGSEHTNIVKFRATARPTFILTPFKELSRIDNNYSDKEERLQFGSVPLVDPFDDQELAQLKQEEADTYRTDKALIRRNCLEDETAVRTLSLIIPVARGRKRTFLDCLDSIRRQSFLAFHPKNVELLVIQDGEITEDDESPISSALSTKIREFRGETRIVLYAYIRPPSSDEELQGRSSIRNVGVLYAQHDIAFFIDSSMVLDKHFLAEQMIRHQRTLQIALLGFKENIKHEDFERNRAAIEEGSVRPDYRKDWKWSHELKHDEVDGPGFTFGERSYRVGEIIHYLSICDNHKKLKGTDHIGKRMLPTFFHTGITSVALETVKQVGGFQPGFNPAWGFEDSFLGALLLTKNVKLVPCPSSVAFKIEHLEDETRKAADIEANRSQFYERLESPLREFNYGSLKQQVRRLRKTGTLKRINYNRNKMIVQILR